MRRRARRGSPPASVGQLETLFARLELGLLARRDVGGSHQRAAFGPPQALDRVAGPLARHVERRQLDLEPVRAPTRTSLIPAPSARSRSRAARLPLSSGRTSRCRGRVSGAGPGSSTSTSCPRGRAPRCDRAASRAPRRASSRCDGGPRRPFRARSSPPRAGAAERRTPGGTERETSRSPPDRR